jgi:predicted DNA-binding protein (UPF0251 family)
MNTEKFKTKQQLADELGMSRSTFWRRLQNTPFTCIKGLISPAQQTEIVKTLEQKDSEIIKNFKNYIKNKYS